MDKHSLISYLNAVVSEVGNLWELIVKERKFVPDAEEINAIEIRGRELKKFGSDMIAESEQLREKYLK